MGSRPGPRTRFCLWPALAALLVCAPAAPGQGTGGPTTGDSSVGYIDTAIPGDQLRLRCDVANDDRIPSRAEFFYAKPGPAGPGLPRPETGIDYQEMFAYLEITAGPRLSGFIESPYRFLQPEVNSPANGFSDLNAGFKYAFVSNPDLVATFQLRTYIPTGDASRGLGTHHVSLEPAFLFFKPLTDRLVLEGELRNWVPIGGTDFAGDVIRYGLGVHYDLAQTQQLHVSPVLELVGWTVLGGKESTVSPSGLVTEEGAAGDTIVNAKAGVRVRWGDRGDIYGGYGQPLTGDRWYQNIVRVELRLFF
ncbi:MAG TPA: hypothetical protein VG013_02590 [Gemmataceae bacterium]|jgi:hypothetical protein|nr:hypothetical protein [Gemmataceae bacterium]